jgi:hypothetical protein
MILCFLFRFLSYISVTVFSGIVTSCKFFFTILLRSCCPCYADTQRNDGRDLCTVKISTWYHQKLWISLTSCYDMTTMNDSRPGKPWSIHTFVSLSYSVLKKTLSYFTAKFLSDVFCESQYFIVSGHASHKSAARAFHFFSTASPIVLWDLKSRVPNSQNLSETSFWSQLLL